MLRNIFIDGNGGILGAVARLGFPVVMAMALVFFLVSKVDTAQAKMLDNQQIIMSNQNALINAMSNATINMSRFAQAAEVEGRMRTKLLLQTCLNTSQTEGQKQTCWDAVK